MSGVRSARSSPGFFLGPQVTGTFCGTVAPWPTVNLEVKSTLAAAGIVVGFILLIVVLLRLTKWQPVELTPSGNAVGQLLRAPALYGHRRPMVLVGLTSIPILAAVWNRAGGRRADRRDGRRNVHPRRRNPLGYAVVAAIAIAYLRDLELGRRSYASAFRTCPALPEGRPRSDPQLHPRVLDRADHHRYPGRDRRQWQFVQQEIMFKDTGMRAAFHGAPGSSGKLVADCSRRACG